MNMISKRLKLNDGGGLDRGIVVHCLARTLWIQPAEGCGGGNTKFRGRNTCPKGFAVALTV